MIRLARRHPGVAIPSPGQTSTVEHVRESTVLIACTGEIDHCPVRLKLLAYRAARRRTAGDTIRAKHVFRFEPCPLSSSIQIWDRSRSSAEQELMSVKAWTLVGLKHVVGIAVVLRDVEVGIDDVLAIVHVSVLIVVPEGELLRHAARNSAIFPEHDCVTCVVHLSSVIGCFKCAGNAMGVI